MCPFNQTKVENHDEQTARWHPMVHLDPGGWGLVYLWPSFGSNVQTFYTSHHSRAFHVWWRWSPMVHIDPGARCIVYLQQQQRMVPSKLPSSIAKENDIFSFHKSLFKNALLSHFLGQQTGYPRRASYLLWPLLGCSQGLTCLESFKGLNGT